jgi:RNA polymerase sigma factor (TIGR02999 family)
MQPPASGKVTQLLAEWNQGDAAALDRLLPLVYAELRRIARGYLRHERQSHTLQPTVLVHEAYLKLVGARVDWRDRAHFYGVAARLMRQILVDHARKRQAAKRGGSARRVSLAEADAKAAPELDLLAMDDALQRLAERDPDQGRIVELRYFGGLTIEETAEVLGRSPAAIKRDWSMARAWLRRELSAESGR